MSFWIVCSLAFALSLDGFGAGAAYGMRKIRVPFVSLLIISFLSVLIMTIALLAGHGLARFIPPNLAVYLGGVILILLGGLQLYNMYLAKSQGEKPQQENNEIVQKERSLGLQSELQAVYALYLKPFGVVIQILREPTRADLDSSGELSSGEASFLGMALGMDAFGAGFGLSLSGGLPLYSPILVGVALLMFVTLGLCWGHSRADLGIGKFGVLPGIVLVLMGLSKFF